MQYFTKTHLKILLLLIFLVALATYGISLRDYFTLEYLKTYREDLALAVTNNLAVSVIHYILAYILCIGLSVPIGIWLNVAGGFLFGKWGAALAIIGATLGACLNFLLMRYIFGTDFQTKYAEKLTKFNREIDKHGHNYLLFLQLSPGFPFFLINFLFGLTKIKLKDFAWLTAIGIAPSSFVYAYAGLQLAILDSLADIFSIQMLITLTLLGLLALFPIIIKKFNF